MRYLLTFAALVFAGLAQAQTTVRIKDQSGNVVAELTIPAGGVYEIVHPGPGPAPQPPNPPQPVPPSPVPPPVPPAPVPNVGPVKHVVIIRDDTPGAMSAAQLAALRDPALRAEIARRGLAWHGFDIAGSEVKAKGYSKWFPGGTNAIPGVRTTAILFLDAQGRLARGLPLPADSASILAEVKAAVGG